MKIQWNKVTWYSRILAVVLFLLVFYVGFTLGGYKTNVVVDPEFTQSFTVKPFNVVSYTCDAGRIIIAKYFQGKSRPSPSPDMPPSPGGSVLLQLSDGRSMILPQTISADGVRYSDADGSFVFWSKGDTAFVLEGAKSEQTFKNCVLVSQTAKF